MCQLLGGSSWIWETMLWMNILHCISLLKGCGMISKCKYFCSALIPWVKLLSMLSVLRLHYGTPLLPPRDHVLRHRSLSNHHATNRHATAQSPWTWVIPNNHKTARIWFVTFVAKKATRSVFAMLPGLVRRKISATPYT